MGLTLTWDEFGADLEGDPSDWDAAADELEHGHFADGVRIEVSTDATQLVVRRVGDVLVVYAAPSHIEMVADMARGLAQAGRAAGPSPVVWRHTELEPEPYLLWVAAESLPIHLVCRPEGRDD